MPVIPYLTKREISVVDRVLDGKRNKQIAYELGLSENTIKVYLSRMYTKFGTDGRMEFAKVMRNHKAAIQSLKGVELGVAPPPIEAEPEQTPFERFLLMAHHLVLNADQARQVLVVLMGGSAVNNDETKS